MRLNKNNILSGIILVLVLVIFLQRCGNNTQSTTSPATIIIRDTLWNKKDSIVYSKPKIIEVIRPQEKDEEAYILPDTVHLDTLHDRYNALVESYLETNIQVDSLKIDSLGYVKLYDSVQKNRIVGRTYEYSFKYPTIKETQYIPLKPKNQIYIGGGISGTARLGVNQIDAGILFKTKKDKIFGAKAGINTLGQMSYGIQSYWKL